MKSMDTKTKKKLEASGWRVGDAKDFLELTDDEAGFIELKLALAQDLRNRRLARGLNQTQVANLIGSSQSRVARMEAADASVSLDLLFAHCSNLVQPARTLRRSCLSVRPQLRHNVSAILLRG